MILFRRLLFAGALTVLLQLGVCQADVVINLDVQGHGTADANNLANTVWIDPAADGVTALQDFSHQWNYHSGMTAGSTTVLSDVIGGTTGITFELVDAVTDVTASSTQIGGAGPYDDVIRDYFKRAGGVHSKLSGLDASGATTYDIYSISALFFPGNWQTITVTGGAGAVSKDLSNPANGGASPQYTGGPLRLGGDYQEFLGVTADANGEISINFGDFNGGGGEGRFAGLQVVVHSAAVPEPSSVLMIGCAGLAVILRRRR